MNDQIAGQCLCGGVRFSAQGKVMRISACYCGQCRRQNGGGAFYGLELEGKLTVEPESQLSWYASSTEAMRGFCTNCGSSLFWKNNLHPSFFDVSLGALHNGDDYRLDAHIFVDNCPAYMSVPDTAPTFTEQEVRANPLSSQ